MVLEAIGQLLGSINILNTGSLLILIAIVVAVARAISTGNSPEEMLYNTLMMCLIMISTFKYENFVNTAVFYTIASICVILIAIPMASSWQKRQRQADLQKS